MGTPSKPPLDASLKTGADEASAPGDPVGTGRRLRRFVVGERLSHWLYALFFLTALITGLLMWIPTTRIWMAGARRELAQYHGYVGAAMIIVPILVLIVLDRRRLLGDIRDVDRWSWNDRRWFGLAIRGYTLRGRQMPPQGRFNAGQKANVVLVAAMAVGFAVTGGILMHRQDMPQWLVSRALWLHAVLAVAGVALLAGHLAHVLFTRHGRTYLAGMVRGWIPEELAREKHQRWWEEQTASLHQAAGGDQTAGGDRPARGDEAAVEQPLAVPGPDAPV